MITRDQMKIMAMLWNRGDTIFSDLPLEILQKITDANQDPNSDITRALHHAAYAREEDVTILLKILDENPRLLLQAGNVITPGGNEVRRITPYEFCLGAGDPDLANKIAPYFANIPNGEALRLQQYERYKPHIEGMLTQKPYNLGPLINILKLATAEDVQALLNKDMMHESLLRDAIIQFRKDYAPRVILKPEMHYNYQSLQHAFETLDNEWDSLSAASGGNYNKNRIVWRLLIGFEMRRLPGVDRCIMAQGLYYVIERGEQLTRSYKFTNDDADFPVTIDDNSLGGLGEDLEVDALLAGFRVWRSGTSEAFKAYVEQKIHACKTYTVIYQQPQTWCIVS